MSEKIQTKEQIAPNIIDWNAIAFLARPVEQDEKRGLGMPVFFGGQELAVAKTKDGIQRLLAVMIIGKVPFGLVLEHRPDQEDRFVLVTIGIDGNKGNPIRYIDFNELSKPREGLGYVQEWQDIKFGSGPDCNVFNGQMFREQAKVRVSPTQVKLFSYPESIGTVSVVKGDLFNVKPGQLQPELASLSEYLQNTSTWSGTSGAQNVLSMPIEQASS